MDNASTEKQAEQSAKTESTVAALVGKLSVLEGQLQNSIQNILTLQTQVKTLTAQLDQTANIANELNQGAEPQRPVSFGPSMGMVDLGSFIQVGTMRPMQLFDMYDLRDNKVKVKGDAVALVLGGQIVAVGTGGSAQFDADITISVAENYIYLKVNRAAQSATLEIATSIPAGTNAEEIYPLWYMHYDTTTTRVDWESRLDLRARVNDAMRADSDKATAVTKSVATSTGTGGRDVLLFDFLLPTPIGSLTASEYILIRKVESGVPILRYTTLSDIAAGLPASTIPWGSIYISGPSATGPIGFDAWLAANHRHTSHLDFEVDDHNFTAAAVVSGTPTYLCDQGTAIRNAMASGSCIGSMITGSGVASISPYDRILYGPDGVAIANWAVAPGGIFTVTAATVASGKTSGALVVTGGVGVSGWLFGSQATFEKTYSGTSYQASLARDDMRLAGWFSDGTRIASLASDIGGAYAGAFTDGTRTVYICIGTPTAWAINVTDGNVNVATGGAYYHNATEGKTNTNISSGGIMTGEFELVNPEQLTSSDLVMIKKR